MKGEATRQNIQKIIICKYCARNSYKIVYIESVSNVCENLQYLYMNIFVHI